MAFGPKDHTRLLGQTLKFTVLTRPWQRRSKIRSLAMRLQIWLTFPVGSALSPKPDKPLNPETPKPYTHNPKTLDSPGSMACEASEPVSDEAFWGRPSKI